MSGPALANGPKAHLAGWGRTVWSRATVLRPGSGPDVSEAIARAGSRGILARGLGRSYGDVAQNAGGTVLDMTALAGIRAFDAQRGTLTASAGTPLDAVLRAVVREGWFPAVTPGTSHVTLGGAIANDVHGKNHHVDGSFCDHVLSFTMACAGGSTRVVTPSDRELFDATAGGLGLTGVVLEATIRLVRIETSWMRIDTERARDLDDLMARMEDGDDRYRYSVAWVDGLAGGAGLGRGVLTRADHATRSELPASHDPLAYRPKRFGSVPPGIPRVIGWPTARAFNELWYRKAPREERGRIAPLAPFFYPLDALGAWPRLYGAHGLVQYQFAVPFGQEGVVRLALERLSRARCPSVLAVLKRFGPGRGMLSFPIPGWTLAIDLPASVRAAAQVLDGLDRAVAEAGGRVYLAKDARLAPSLLPSMYPELDRWLDVRERLDPSHIFRSDLDRRLLDPTTSLAGRSLLETTAGRSSG